MSTIAECLKRGDLLPFMPQLSWRQIRQRTVYGKPDCIEWFKNDLPKLTTDGFSLGAVTPREQAIIMLRKFTAGEDFKPPLPHEMNPIGEGVWRIRTPDLRFVGWFPQRCTFVVADIDAKANCDQIRDNGMYQSTLEFRKHLDLLGGSFAKGGLDGLIRI